MKKDALLLAAALSACAPNEPTDTAQDPLTAMQNCAPLYEGATSNEDGEGLNLFLYINETQADVLERIDLILQDTEGSDACIAGGAADVEKDAGGTGLVEVFAYTPEVGDCSKWRMDATGRDASGQGYPLHFNGRYPNTMLAIANNGANVNSALENERDEFYMPCDTSEY